MLCSKDNGALLHTLMQQTHVIEQNDMTIDEYYSASDRLMSALLSMVPACATNPCPAHQFIEKFFTYKFVMGFELNMTRRARLLHNSDTLTMAKVLSELLAEVTRLKALSSATGSSSHSVLAAAQKSYVARSCFSVPCEHCKKNTRRSENCFVKISREVG